MRLIRSLVIVSAFITVLSSCGQPEQSPKEVDSKPLVIKKKQTLNSSSPTDTKDHPSGLEDGFYSDVRTLEPNNDLYIASSEEKIPASVIERSGKQDNSSKEKSIVEDLEFSSATNSFKDSSEAEKLFCIDPDLLNKKKLIEKSCKRMADRLASVNYERCLAAKLQTTGCQSVQGFPILMREFEPLKSRKPLGRILVIGGTHGDELTSVSVTMRWIDQLSKNHSGLFHWHMAPLMNPDAVLKPAATRTNHNGVDLNRNMPSNDWTEKAIKYWRVKNGKDVRKYPGEKPASEPETQWLIDEINHFKPDAIISVHAPYGVVDFDSLLLNTAPKSLGKLHLNLLGTYPGSLGNYAGINRNIPVITLELPHSWEMPSVQDSDKIWQDIVQWLTHNVNSTVTQNQ
jgi:hypothetical protein